MLYSITNEIPGKLNGEWLPTWNICLSKGIGEFNTLTLQTYNKMKNKHQPHCDTLYYRRIQVQRFRRQSPMDIPSHTISCLKFIDCSIMFPLVLEGPCSWKNFFSVTDFGKQSLMCHFS